MAHPPWFERHSPSPSSTRNVVLDMDRFARALERAPRRPVWSQLLTAPLSRRVPQDQRALVLVLIKAFHSVAFFSIGGLILLFTWDGLRGRRTRRATVAGLVAMGESAIYGSNNMVCPLTPLAEELGASSGSVTDIYLPDWLSRRVPLFGGGTLLVGLVVHGRLLITQRTRTA
jgi:hypothetical protein